MKQLSKNTRFRTKTLDKINVEHILDFLSVLSVDNENFDHILISSVRTQAVADIDLKLSLRWTITLMDKNTISIGVLLAFRTTLSFLLLAQNIVYLRMTYATHHYQFFIGCNAVGVHMPVSKAKQFSPFLLSKTHKEREIVRERRSIVNTYAEREREKYWKQVDYDWNSNY